MTDEYIRKHDAIAIAESYQVERTGFHLNDYEYGRNQVADSIASDLEDIEPADVVPVVRCGQCGYWHDNDGDYGYCYAKDGQGFGHAWRKNDFCSYGERKGRV